MAPTPNIDVLINTEGQALLVSPDGQPVQVSPDLASELLGEGYRPESVEDHRKRYKIEQFAKQTSPSEAFGMGAAGTLTFGLSDVLARDAGLYSKEELAALEQEHPTASVIGKTAGLVAPAFATGGASLLAKGGSALGTGLAKAAAATPMAALQSGAAGLGSRAAAAVGRAGGGGALQKIAGTATRGAIEGGGIGAGQMLSHYAQTDDLDPGAILMGAGTGAALGLGFEAMGGILGAGSRALKKKRLIGKPLAKPGTTPPAGVTLPRSRAGVDPYAETAIGTRPMVDPFGKTVGPRIVGAEKAAVSEGAATTPRLFDQLIGPIAKRAAAGAILGGFAGGREGALVGGALGALGVRVAQKIVPPIVRGAAKLGRGAAKLERATEARRSLPPAMTSDAYLSYQERLTDEGMEEFSQRVTQEEAQKALAFGMDPEAVQKAVDYKMSAMAILAEELPKRRQEIPKEDARSIVQGKYVPTPAERLAFGRKAGAVEDPAGVFHRFQDGSGVHRDEVAMLKLRVPEALKQFQDLVRDAIAMAQPGSLSVAQIRYVNQILDVPIDQDYLGMIQGNHAAAEQEQQKQGPPPSTGPTRMAQAFETHVQTALKG